MPTTPLLDFTTLTFNDIKRIRPFLRHNPSRTCDMTVGGIFLWADYFHYRAAIDEDTLFILGTTEDNTNRPAFSIPSGAMSLDRAINRLRKYCAVYHIPLVFSAVPQMYLEQLQALGATHISELTDWADYLYDAKALATLSGKKLMKKRNHANHFAIQYPDAEFQPLTSDNVTPILEFYNRQTLPANKSETAGFDREETIITLQHLDKFGFEGGVLSVPGIGVVAFTLGELIDDTLYVHIEKMDHNINGSGETVCRNFASMMLQKHPEIRYINREDASGDEGLRRAKLAYNPIDILPKYNVEF